jgi:hypothetical protein
MNVIGSSILERDAGGKPLHTFPHPAPGKSRTRGTTGDIWLLHSQAAFGIGLRSGGR